MADISYIPEHIVNGDIFPILLREIASVKADRPNAENLRILAGFLGLREVCKEWKHVVDDTVEYNALRLAIWDAGQVGVTIHVAYGIDIFFREQYMSNLEVFSTTQRLVTPVEDYQLTTPMKDLSITDLRAIRDTLCIGRIQRDLLPSHAWEWETEQIWTTPLER